MEMFFITVHEKNKRKKEGVTRVKEKNYWFIH
jgi:hypothetical protein